MRIKVDLESDALYFRISEESIEESKYRLEDLTSFRVEIPDTPKTTVCAGDSPG